MPLFGDELWKFANAEVFEVDRRAFGFEAEVAVGRVAVGSAGDFLAVHPEANFAVDGADVVVVPFADSFGEAFGGEAAGAVGGDGWEGLHFCRTGGKDVAMGGEPIGGCAFALFPVGFVGEIENLDFDAIRELSFAGGEVVDGGLAGPGEDAGVSGGLVVSPFANHFEVFDGLGGADHANGIAGAGDGVAIPGPGVFLAVDVDEVLAGEVPPTFSGAIDDGFFEFGGIGSRRFFIGAAEGGEGGEAEEGGPEGRAG